MTRVVSSIAEWQQIRKSALRDSQIGFVPTMGALHQGHLDLMARSQRENTITVVSIFVNPTQFKQTKDAQNYPKKMERDLNLLKQAQVQYLFAPEYNEMYPDDFRYKIIETDFSKKLCGGGGAMNFDGVLTVVMKLLNVVGPHRAYFGEKDYQQYLLIKGMCEAFFHPTQVISCETVRDEHGLALSSRNEMLSPEDRKKAIQINKVLRGGSSIAEIRAKLESVGFDVEYIEEISDRRFVAVRIGGIRLIDNVKI